MDVALWKRAVCEFLMNFCPSWDGAYPEGVKSNQERWNEANRKTRREIPTGPSDCSRWFATATGSNLLAWCAGSAAEDEELRALKSARRIEFVGIRVQFCCIATKKNYIIIPFLCCDQTKERIPFPTRKIKYVCSKCTAVSIRQQYFCHFYSSD